MSTPKEEICSQTPSRGESLHGEDRKDGTFRRNNIADRTLDPRSVEV
jgi:hypothetical protein